MCKQREKTFSVETENSFLKLYMIVNDFLVKCVHQHFSKNAILKSHQQKHMKKADFCIVCCIKHYLMILPFLANQKACISNIYPFFLLKLFVLVLFLLPYDQPANSKILSLSN